MRRCNKREVYPDGMQFLLSRSRPLAYFALFWVAWSNAAISGRLEASSALKKTVLVLYGDRLSIPAMKTTDQGLIAGLSRRQPEDLEIFSESLDLAHFPAAQYGDDPFRYLSTRYATRKPDIVIAVASSALYFAPAHRNEFFLVAPTV